MIKSLELTIALVILFGFLIFAYQTHGVANTASLKYQEENQNIINYFATDSGFRDNINEKNVDLVYDILYPYMNQNYVIGICDFIEDDCIYNNEEILINKKTLTYDYFFIDINKTLYVIVY